MVNVLVICTHNSARSQMAEAFLRKHGAHLFNVYSAGMAPTEIHPLVPVVMKESGIDVTMQGAKSFENYLGTLSVYYLIVMSAEAEKKALNCWPGVFEQVYWSFEDPAAATGSEEEKLQKFRQVRDQIEAKVKEWIAKRGGK